ncbi:hypothetical protein AIOL_002320 [Candidatus Rhodobacter oscarellae]|uniref:Lipoprotein n=1 Tax=Candidatus Rhodobacter oscarellae TaxID=1675527 RepID=A0A0J9E3R5_9RHOB|nr:hypothetical protein [Candidatus Rhodobacter lobularis]KMW57357.1 hypothetical protein AIOL_002320 [Candidatus Rhodobacter lobularis]
MKHLLLALHMPLILAGCATGYWGDYKPGVRPVDMYKGITECRRGRVTHDTAVVLVAPTRQTITARASASVTSGSSSATARAEVQTRTRTEIDYEALNAIDDILAERKEWRCLEALGYRFKTIPRCPRPPSQAELLQALRSTPPVSKQLCAYPVEPDKRGVPTFVFLDYG